MANQHHIPEHYGFSLHNPEHRERFNRLKNRPWEGTGFLDFNMLDRLGIIGDIQEMGERIGWRDHDRLGENDFLHLREHTYKGLTLEFLSTLDVDVVSGDESEDVLCDFQLGNQEWGLGMQAINSFFGFSEDVYNGTYRESRERVNRFNEFWPRMAALGENGAANRYRASKINNPCLRVFHSFMAHTIFGRGDKHELTQEECIIFEAALTETLINPAALMMVHLRSVAGRSSGSIAIGGLVTRIANQLSKPDTPIPLEGNGINLNIIGQNRIEPTPIDINLLQDMGVLFRIDRQGGLPNPHPNWPKYSWSLQGHGENNPRVIRLPNIPRTTIEEENNWVIQIQPHDHNQEQEYNAAQNED